MSGSRNEPLADAHRSERSPMPPADDEPDEQHGGDHHVDGRPGQRHPQLLARVVGHALEPRHAADRQQRDVARGDAVAARGQRVPELVQHHAEKERQDEHQARDARPGGLTGASARRRPTEQQQERRVDEDADARTSAIFQDHFIRPPAPYRGPLQRRFQNLRAAASNSRENGF